MDPMDRMVWKGAPITYKRKRGTGYIIGMKHYRFTPAGDLEHLEDLTRHTLHTVLSGISEKPDMLMVAKAATVSSLIRKQQQQQKEPR